MKIKQKLDFKSVKNMLSKNELKNIMAGSGGSGGGSFPCAGCGQQNGYWCSGTIPGCGFTCSNGVCVY
ncbi:MULTISPECIES: hypothetical protein [unclassified Mucilaginibacter]|uniref:hypothetical protein n=1 Tax=unclassified Mucilaginibacter TaxID=2617802 RepID=UPI002AC99163|nr:MULTISPECIES: hypothetical protein [unclassified Mucilaginibacter]MEB0280871.1 hypothetical protein [Mucilaginibacter sp. 10B2]MEB0302748.1 hypothetical protein [Mucilaginibacter sp. 5C4]WPX25646.1 hypothetical protein RHM67_10255 [Mucilaginibacter sp. 5C4]